MDDRGEALIPPSLAPCSAPLTDLIQKQTASSVILRKRTDEKCKHSTYFKAFRRKKEKKTKKDTQNMNAKGNLYTTLKSSSQAMAF